MKIKFETVSSIKLPVDEVLEIKRCRYQNIQDKKRAKRIALVTGTHGDELEGQYIAYLMGKRIKANPDLLNGTVDIYPATNPLGIDSIERGFPGFDLDMNRVFPGSSYGTMVDMVAKNIVDSLEGAELVLDLHASNIFLTEIPQARINEHMRDLIPIAQKLNLDFLWVHANATVLESTLCYSLNKRGVPCVVIEAGVGMRITKEYGIQLTDGIFNTMKEMGMWNESDTFTKPQHDYIISDNREVYFLNANASGVFVQEAKHSDILKKGDIIGKILDPLSSSVKEEIRSPADGLLFTLREYPVVYTGSLIARLLGEEKVK